MRGLDATPLGVTILDIEIFPAGWRQESKWHSHIPVNNGTQDKHAATQRRNYNALITLKTGSVEVPARVSCDPSDLPKGKFWDDLWLNSE